MKRQAGNPLRVICYVGNPFRVIYYVRKAKRPAEARARESRAARRSRIGSLAAAAALLAALAAGLRAQSAASLNANRDNVRYADAFPGTDACVQIQNAVNDLPPTGGIVMANFTGTQNCAGGFNVGTPPYAGPSSAPTLSYVAGGTLAATTYYVKTTWMNSAGESLASPEASLAVPANNLLVVTSPASGGALSDQGWNVYVGTASGAETQQNAYIPIAIGTNWTEPTTGLVSGQSLSAVGTDNKPVELKLGGTTLVVGAPITVYASSSITGLPQGMNTYFPNASEIQAKAGANLAELVELGDGSAASNNELQMLRDLTLDGNDPPGAQVGLLINKSGRVTLQNVTARNMASHGVEFLSSSDESCCATIEQLFSSSNGGDGLYVVNTSDLFIAKSQFENNTGNGVELSASGGIRMVQEDFGQNHGAGVLMENGSVGNWIMDSQIDNEGTNVNLGTGNQNTVIGNQFIGVGPTNPGTSDGIYSNGQWNVIVGNTFQFNTSSEYRYSINLDTSAIRNTVAENNLMGLNNVSSGGGINNPNGAANSLSNNWVSNAYQSASTPATYYNNLPLKWLDTSGNAQNALWLDGSNNVNLGSPNAIKITAGGTNQNITLTPAPSGTGIVQVNGNLQTGSNLCFGGGSNCVTTGQPSFVFNPGQTVSGVQTTLFGILDINTAWLGAFDTSGDLGVAGSVQSGTGVRISGASGPTWTSGSAAPTGSCTTGSIYSNTAGAAGSTLYACVSGAWVDVK